MKKTRKNRHRCQIDKSLSQTSLKLTKIWSFGIKKKHTKKDFENYKHEKRNQSLMLHEELVLFLQPR